MKLLHIDSSILGTSSISRLLSREIVEKERQQHPGIEVTYRDLAAEPVGHLQGAYLGGAKEGQPEEVRREVELGAKLVDEFLAADIVVIGAPMYNFSVSTQLKAWIDRIAVRGKTFRYTDKGPVGLAGGKKIIVASSRGGLYSAGTPMALLEHHETYLKTVFQFFGVMDVTFVRAEGMAISDLREKSLASAREAIAQLN